MKHFTEDPHGNLAQPLGNGLVNGGDSANWQGHRVSLDPRQSIKAFIDYFKVGFGAYVRSSDPNLSSPRGSAAFYKNPWHGNITRDQLVGILRALIARGERWELLQVFLHHAAWLWLFAYNTVKNGLPPDKAPWKWPDPTGPAIWAMYIRGFLGPLSYILYPVLCLLDLEVLIAAWLRKGKKNDEVISHLGKLFTAVEIAPTIVSKKALALTDPKEIGRDLKGYWASPDPKKLYRGNPGMIALFMDRLLRLKGVKK